jgi:hypothetical protein
MRRTTDLSKWFSHENKLDCCSEISSKEQEPMPVVSYAKYPDLYEAQWILASEASIEEPTRPIMIGLEESRWRSLDSAIPVL